MEMARIVATDNGADVNVDKFLALDLEMNQPSGRIIQVGVAWGAIGRPESLQTRQWLLSPDEPLSPEIVALTGITEDDLLERAVSWPQLVLELGALLAAESPFVNPVTWGEGDSRLLREALRARGLEFPFFGRRCIDVKSWHTLNALAQGKNPAGGLKSVMGRYNLPFKGSAHRADVDALNTLRLFFRLLERQATLESLVRTARACP